MIDNEGNVLTDSQVIEISFFHLKNPLVQLVVGALIVLLLISMLLISRGKNEKVKKDIESIEEVIKTLEPEKTNKKKKTKKSAK